MPNRKATTAALAAAAAMPVMPKDLIDQFVTGPMSAEAVESVSMAFKGALIERAPSAERSHHLGYRPGAEKPEDSSNHRNGGSAKTVLTGEGPLRIEVPCDRAYAGMALTLLLALADRYVGGGARRAARAGPGGASNSVV